MLSMKNFARVTYCLMCCRSSSVIVGAAELAEMVRNDRADGCRHFLADLGKVVDLDEEALAGVPSPDAPWLDALNGLEDLGRVGEGDLQCLRDLLERHLEIPEVVEVTDDVLGDGMQ